MNHKTLVTLAFAVAGLALAGCGTQSGSPVPVANALRPAVSSPQVHAVPASSGQLAVSSCEPCATYTNGPSSEQFFENGLKKPFRTVKNGIAAPWVGLVFNSSGDLFVANCTTCLTGQSGVNNVVELKPKQSTPVVTITNGITYPFDLAIDSAGTLYASNLGCYSPSCSGSVSEYSAGYKSGSPARQLSVTYPLGLAIDGNQNLYVANCAVCSTGQTGSDQILVYAQGSTTPTRTISTGVNEPVALAVDSSNDLYVANCINCGLGAAYNLSGTDTVTEYAAGGAYPVKTITFSGADVPFSMAVDQSGDLFVGNFAASSVTEYPPGDTQPSRTITNGVSNPASLAINSVGTLFVSNSGANTVTSYPPNYKGVQSPHTISVMYPSSIATSK